MKNFFIKYLPFLSSKAEGWFIDLRNSELIYYNGDYGEKRPEFIEPARMYVCHREISPGDRVMFFTPGGYVEKVFEPGDEAHGNLYKPIGYVAENCEQFGKEGMELDEKDFFCLEWGGSSVRKPFSRVADEFIGSMKIFLKNNEGKFLYKKS